MKKTVSLRLASIKAPDVDNEQRNGEQDAALLTVARKPRVLFASRSSEVEGVEKPRGRRCCCRRRASDAHRSKAQTLGLDASLALGTALPHDPTEGHESFVINEDSAEVYARHAGRWDCLVRWCCPIRSRREDEEQQKLVTAHLALITARYFRHGPTKRQWTRGLIALRAESEAEDEEFFEARAPEPAEWPHHHFALDIGVGPLSGKSAPPPLISIMYAAVHFAKFATGAYGRGIYVLMRPVFSCLTLGCCTLSDRGAFARLTGVRKTDILYSSSTAEPFKPLWWLCIDKASSSIVIAVRGTFGTGDVVSDALARQVEFKGHVVHQGMLLSAQWLLGKVLPMLKGIAGFDSGQYRLVTTGHSLGGGVSAMLAWLLRKDHETGPCAECRSFVYGAPLICDRVLAEKMRSFVVHIVHNKDMVPRISMKTMEDLRDRICSMVETPEDRVSRYETVLREFDLPCEPNDLRQALSAGVLRRSTPDARSMASSEPDESLISRDAIADAHVLKTSPQFSPGYCLHLCRRAKKYRWLEGIPILRQGALNHFAVMAWTPDVEFFQAVKPATSMWTDHFPQGYLYVCQAYLEGIEKSAASHRRMSLRRSLPGAVTCPANLHSSSAWERASGGRVSLEDVMFDLEAYFGGGRHSASSDISRESANETGVELGDLRQSV